METHLPGEDAQTGFVKDVMEGDHGLFVKVRTKIGSVTFSGEKEKGEWLEERLPRGSDKVVVWDITMTKKGWRANKAKFFRPGDEDKE